MTTKLNILDIENLIETKHGKYHLGGHLNKTHTDEAIIKFIKYEYNIKSIIDIGCGPGGMSQVCLDEGIDWFGVDGDFTVIPKDNSLVHDFSDGPPSIDRTFDCAWSVEFLEHVDEEYVDNFMKAFQLADKMIIATAATPGTPGHHHVNCQPLEYWIDVFDNYGYEYSEEVTKTIKEISSMKKPFIKRHGFALFKK
jgi:hypothetical protein